MRGDDVALLHRELQYLGLRIDGAEVEDKRFGTGTRNIVLGFQREHGLEGTGVVDENTARRVSTEVKARGSDAVANVFAVRGTLLNPYGSPVPRAIIKAFDTGLRSETPLGETATEAEASTKFITGRSSLQQPGRPPLI
jgi:peptidoglycan hydrolase-like protein with peptidoglycan-binding domain